MRELSDDVLDRIVRKAWGNEWMLPGEPQRMLVRAGYAAGYRAAQAVKPGPLDHQSAATSVSDGATAAPSEATASVTDPAADPLPVAWATPSLLVTMSAVEKRRLTSPEMRGRGGEWEADARDADRYSVPLYRADALERLRAERDDLREEYRKVEVLWKQDTIDRDNALRDLARAMQERIDVAITERDEARRDVEQHYIRNKELRAERDTLAAIVRAVDAMEPYADQGHIEYKRARAKWEGK